MTTHDTSTNHTQELLHLSKSLLILKFNHTLTTSTTCLEPQTSVTLVYTRLMTSAPSPTLRSSKRRRTAGSTRARSTRTRLKTPVCVPIRVAQSLSPVACRLHTTNPSLHLLRTNLTGYQRMNAPSPTSSPAKRSARRRLMSPRQRRTGSARRTPPCPRCRTATSHRGEPSSTSS